MPVSPPPSPPDDAIPDDQSKIWAHAQNEAPESFAAAGPRLRFLVRQIARRAAAANIGRPVVLNVGVGDGRLERDAADRGWAVHSLDPVPESMAKLAADRPEIATHVGVLERVPLPDAAVDFAVASEVLEHLSEAQRTAGVAELARVLRPGGWFLGTVPWDEDLSLRETVCPACGLVFHQYGHRARFREEDVERLLAPHFEFVETGRSAFAAFRGRGPAGWLKSGLREALARGGQPIAVPRLWWAARRPG